MTSFSMETLTLTSIKYAMKNHKSTSPHNRGVKQRESMNGFKMIYEKMLGAGKSAVLRQDSQIRLKGDLCSVTTVECGSYKNSCQKSHIR